MLGLTHQIGDHDCTCPSAESSVGLQLQSPYDCQGSNRIESNQIELCDSLPPAQPCAEVRPSGPGVHCHSENENTTSVR